MSWAHFASLDGGVHWRELAVALTNDAAYDVGGVFTGSTTVLPEGAGPVAI
jgi:sucrose-6-phosphate hydrolase SacC (GH32 family)